MKLADWARAQEIDYKVGAGLAALVGLTGILAPSTARTFPIRWYWI